MRFSLCSTRRVFHLSPLAWPGGPLQATSARLTYAPVKTRERLRGGGVPEIGTEARLTWLNSDALMGVVFNLFNVRRCGCVCRAPFTFSITYLRLSFMSDHDELLYDLAWFSPQRGRRYAVACGTNLRSGAITGQRPKRHRAAAPLGEKND